MEWNGKHLPEMIFVVVLPVLLFSYDSIILENIYVFNHIFRLFIGNKTPTEGPSVGTYSTGIFY